MAEFIWKRGRYEYTECWCSLLGSTCFQMQYKQGYGKTYFNENNCNKPTIIIYFWDDGITNVCFRISKYKLFI